MTVKNNVLIKLEENRGKFISGEMLAKDLNVSRTAIWKAINTLKKEGYKIEATTNKGYVLNLDNDLISAEAIKLGLNKNLKDISIKVFSNLDSTNDQAKRDSVDEKNDFIVYISDGLSKARGRMGRSFFAPAGFGIYLSIMFKPKFNIENAILVTTATSVAVTKTIEKLTDKKPQIKWVNDIYLNNKKLCGILTEATGDLETGGINKIIVGIGLNFKPANYPEEIKDIVTPLLSEDVSLTRNKFIATLLNEFSKIIENIETHEFLEYYKNHSLVIGKDIYYIKNDLKHFAKAIDIDQNGGLVVLENGKKVLLNSGEITLRKA